MSNEYCSMVIDAQVNMSRKAVRFLKVRNYLALSAA